MAMQPSRKPKTLRPASVRQRRLRERQRLGLVVAPVPVGLDVIETLMALRWLPVEKSEDRESIGDAVGRMLAELAASQRKK